LIGLAFQFLASSRLGVGGDRLPRPSRGSATGPTPNEIMAKSMLTATDGCDAAAETAAKATTTNRLMSSQSPSTATTSRTTTTTKFYREVWFIVVACIASVVLLIALTLILVKCCCDRRRPYVRQRVPLDQSVKTSPPSYRYHDNRHHDDYTGRMFFDKRRVRCYMNLDFILLLYNFFIVLNGLMCSCEIMYSLTVQGCSKKSRR